MAITHYYVDPSVASDGGSGTDISPWTRADKDVIAYAVETGITQGADGDQVNVKAGGTVETVAALDISLYGTPTSDQPLIIAGYTTAANDGGKGDIDCNGVAFINTTTYDWVHLRHLKIHDGPTGAVNMVQVDRSCGVTECEFYNYSGSLAALALDTGSEVRGCYFHDITGGKAIVGTAATVVAIGNLFDVAVTSAVMDTVSVMMFNIIKCSDNGLVQGLALTSGSLVMFNSLYHSGAPTGVAIQSNSASGRDEAIIMNNIIEGWDGTGAAAIKFRSATETWNFLGYNAFFNNTTNIDNTVGAIILNDQTAGDEILGASPFTNPATNDFTVGTSVKALAYPMFGGHHVQYLDMGAVQREEPAGGAGGVATLIGAGGGLIG